MRTKKENGDGKREARERQAESHSKRRARKEDDGGTARERASKRKGKGAKCRERRARSSDHPIKGSLLKDPYRVTGGAKLSVQLLLLGSEVRENRK